jgi:hypothetical protein
MLGHLLSRLGPGARYWDVGGGRQPVVGVSERPPTEQRPYTVLSTVGMSCQRMPVIEQVMEDPSGFARIELAIATTMPSPEAARIFLWLAQYPWRAITWFGAGHSIRWYHEPTTFPLGGGNEAVLLLDDPAQLIGPEVPDLSGFAFASEPVRWLWILPITERERQLAKERGASSLITQLAAQRRSWVFGRLAARGPPRALMQVEADAEQGEEPEEYREQRGEHTLDKADGYVSTGPCHHDADDDVDNEDDADRPFEHRSALPSPERG